MSSWQADRWAMFTSVALTGQMAMLCRCCSDIPPQCNHSDQHININAKPQRRMHHFCSVLSHCGYTWTHINYWSHCAAGTRAITREGRSQKMAKWVPTRKRQHSPVTSGLLPFVKVFWNDGENLLDRERNAGILAKASRCFFMFVPECQHRKQNKLQFVC